MAILGDDEPLFSFLSLWNFFGIRRIPGPSLSRLIAFFNWLRKASWNGFG